MPAEPASIEYSPPAALLAWPRDIPLAASLAAQGSRDPWTILARPSGAWAWSARSGWRALAPTREAFAHADADPLDAIGALAAATPGRPPARADDPPFTGGWMLALSYDLGRVIEPAAGAAPRARDDRAWPEVVLVRAPGAYAHDGRSGRWWRVGDARILPNLAPPAGDAPWAMGAPDLAAAGAYTRAAARVLEYIRAGDVYQVNLTHRLSAGFSGSARALAADLLETARPWHGAYLELDEPHARRAIVSASPELFLDADLTTGLVRTRPMKGTRPAHADPDELYRAEKDRAELDMIIDLMRNDLGRVCRPGTVRVESARDIEHHASGVLQATATVAGRLRGSVGVADLLRATFPPGSVTGVPKIRAMQIIDGLETSPRAHYCGAVGFLSDSGRLRLSVAIRTALLTGRPAPGALDEFEEGALDLGVGAGIVADSDPDAEWRESIDKARFMLDLAASRAPLVQAP